MTQFEISIFYNKKDIKVKVLSISNELPHIIYSVTSGDKELINLFKKVKSVFFHIKSKVSENGKLEIQIVS